MGSHVDTPGWQAFELRMQERILARRRRTRRRWIAVVGGALAYGLIAAPPIVQRRAAPAPSPADAEIEPLPDVAPAPPLADLIASTAVEPPPAPPAPAETRDEQVTPLADPDPAPRAQPDSPVKAAAVAEAPREPVAPTFVEAARADRARAELLSLEPAPVETAPSPPPIRAEPPIEAAVPALGVETAEARPSAPPPRVAPAFRVDEVRQAIERYRDAYQRLDAGAAHAVWPAVDQGALARAFDGLASQRIDFDRCNISRDGPGAIAVCSGRASYVPKVGRAPGPVAREWRFRLRQTLSGWTIASADVR